MIGTQSEALWPRDQSHITPHSSPLTCLNPVHILTPSYLQYTLILSMPPTFSLHFNFPNMILYVYSCPSCSRQALSRVYILKDETYEIFMVVTVKISVFQGVMPCIRVSHLGRLKH